MQIFNQINARKLKKDELNVFAGVCDNIWFNIITVLTFGVQMGIVELGGQALKACPLSWRQNLTCWIVGMGELPWGLIIKFAPVKWFQCIAMDDAPMSEEEQAKSLVSSLKPSMSTVKKGEKSARKAAKKASKSSGSADGFQRDKN